MDEKSKIIKSPVDDIKAGRVLDVMVAEIVMGWYKSKPLGLDWVDGKGMSRSVGLFKPSTHDEHAIEALQKFTCTHIVKLNDTWTCCINPWNRCSGNTFALAVSRAVVKESLIDHPPDLHHSGSGMEIKQV